VNRGWHLALSLLTVVAIIGAVGLDVAADFSAMSCCAATNYACKGMRTPDDCCRAMHHLAPRPSTSATAIHVVHAPATTPLITTYTLPTTATVASRLEARPLKRPHDPPHLHTFVPLI
jgi:hypothetical protein